MAYEKGLMRPDRGQFIDKGNYHFDPRHPDFAGGADPDGLRDSTQAFRECDAEAAAAGAGVVVGPGTYKIDSSLTFAAGWDLHDGAILRPANGVTLTFNAQVRGWGSRATIFDTSLGGSFVTNGGEWFFNANGFAGGALLDMGGMGRNVMAYDAEGDGVTNDRAAIATADALSGPNLFGAGTYLVESNLTMSSASVFAQGAKIKPASGVTLTVSGSINAGTYQIFDVSDGGGVQFTRGVQDVVYPEWFGADPTGVADSTDAMQAAVDACITVGDKTSTTRTATAKLVLTGQYKLTEPLAVESVLYFEMSGSRPDAGLLWTDGMAACLDLNGIAHCVFSNFLLTGASATDVCTDVVRVRKQSVNRTTTQNTFHCINIGGKFVNGFNVGYTSGGVQVDNDTLYQCHVRGQWTAGETTYWQKAFRIGDAVFANNLNHLMIHPHAISCRYGVHIDATNVTIEGGEFQSNEVDLLCDAVGPVVVRGIRSENSTRFLSSSASGSAIRNWSFEDIRFYAPSINADGYWMRFLHAGSYRVQNCRVENVAVGVTPVILLQNGVNIALLVTNLHTPALERLAISYTASFHKIISLGYTEGESTVTSQEGMVMRGATMKWAASGGTSDVEIYRQAADVLGLASGDNLLLENGQIRLAAAGSAASPDVTIRRGAADALALGASDNFRLENGAVQFAATGSLASPDVEINRAAANVLGLANGDSLQLEGGELKFAPAGSPGSPDAKLVRAGAGAVGAGNGGHLRLEGGKLQFAPAGSPGSPDVELYRPEVGVIAIGSGDRLLLDDAYIRFSTGAGTYDVEFGRTAADQLGMAAGDSFKVDGTWNGGHLVLATHHIWVDATGDLRIKNGAPASDLDGTVVGAQT